MEVNQTGKNYDAIAEWWREQHRDSGYGVKQLGRALSFVKNRSRALDVGCGSSGRFMRVMQEAGFEELTGIDVSAEMLVLAKREVSGAEYFQGDITNVDLESDYDFISAWDSTFHLPMDAQEPALKNICDALKPEGVLLFTCGGVSEPELRSGVFQGQKFEYSSLGVDTYLTLLRDFQCECLHVEFDQGADESHVYIIARKRERR